MALKVDLEIVWKTIHADLPGLHETVAALIRQMAPMPKHSEDWSGVSDLHSGAV